MLRIGEWVFQEACRRARDWPDDVRVAVNVSPIQFRNPALNGVILQALANGGISPERLELEITESIFKHHSARSALNYVGEFHLGSIAARFSAVPAGMATHLPR